MNLFRRNWIWFIQLFRINYSGNVHSVQLLNLLVLSRYSFFSDFNCIKYCHHGWVQPSLLTVIPFAAILQYNLSFQVYARLKVQTAFLWTSEWWKPSFYVTKFLPAHAYLSQVWVKYSTMWRLVPKSTRSYTAYSLHIHSRYWSIPDPILDSPC